MVSSTTLNSESILDQKGNPLARESAVFLKALDKLLTVRAYYSPEHTQYIEASEKVCEQIVESIRPDLSKTIEITAAGMVIEGQLIDPNHRNVRMLHELLVPLNIAQLNIDGRLTPEDLRQAFTALQEHRQNLGNTTSFREVVIENLPSTVNTESKGVVHCEDGEDPDETEGHRGSGLALDQLLDSVVSDEESPTGSDTEMLARKFMDIVNRILANLESEEQEALADGSPPHPDSTPENIRALREALRRLVEVNPDPRDLARLIEHAKKALDLSRDPGSVDLVFSLLKKEAESHGDWKETSREEHPQPRRTSFNLSLEELKTQVDELSATPVEVPDPTSSSLTDHLGLCLNLLRLNPADILEEALVANVNDILEDPGLATDDLECCSAAAMDSVLNDHQVAVDRLLPAFCSPLRKSHPEALAGFWIRACENLTPERRPLAWPHLVNDLLLGMKGVSPETEKSLWLSAAKVPPKTVVTQVSRLECLSALRKQKTGPGLMKLPLQPMFSIHLALMKSSLAPNHGPRIHHHLLRQPPNELAGILLKAAGKFEASNINFYLSLIRHSEIASMSVELRRMSARLLAESLRKLKHDQRGNAWVAKAVRWLSDLDHDIAEPVLKRIQEERRFFILFKAWPPQVREAAAATLEANRIEPAHGEDEG